MDEAWEADRSERHTGSQAPERFQALYDQFVGPIYRFCLRRLGSDAAGAEDVTSDIFTAIWRKIDKVPPPPEERVYVYAVAYRQVRWYRQKRWARLRLQRRLEGEWAGEATTEPGAAVHDEMPARVRSAVRRLPAAERDALLLVMWDGLSHAEAARILGCSANAVALRLHKARARLRGELGADGADAEDERVVPLYPEHLPSDGI